MPWDARSGLKLDLFAVYLPCHLEAKWPGKLVQDGNGQCATVSAPIGERLNGLGSPFGFETPIPPPSRCKWCPGLNGLGSPFGIETLLHLTVDRLDIGG